MNFFFISLILSAIITVSTLFMATDKRIDQGKFALKIFLISFITNAIGLYFLIEGPNTCPDIEIGEIDF